MTKILAVAARDTYGVYVLTNGTNGLTDVDMHAMASSGRTLTRSPVIAVFENDESLQEFCRVHGLRCDGYLRRTPKASETARPASIKGNSDGEHLDGIARAILDVLREGDGMHTEELDRALIIAVLRTAFAGTR